MEIQASYPNQGFYKMKKEKLAYEEINSTRMDFDVLDYISYLKSF